MDLAEMTRAHWDAAWHPRGRPVTTRTARIVGTHRLVDDPNPKHAPRTSMQEDVQIVVEVRGDTELLPPVTSITWQQARRRARAQLGMKRGHAGPRPIKVRAVNYDKHAPKFGTWYGNKLADIVEQRRESAHRSRSSQRRTRRLLKGLPV